MRYRLSPGVIITPKFPKNTRNAARDRQQWKEARHAQDPHCYYCLGETVLGNHHSADRPDNLATVDHFNPLSGGGLDLPNNWRLSCIACNELKAYTPGREFMRMLAELAEDAA